MSSPNGHTPTSDDFPLAEQRELAFQTVPLGWWSYNVEERRVYWDERVREMFGVSEPTQNYDEVIERIHPEDRDMVRNKVEAALDPRWAVPYHAEYRILRNDGRMRWVLSRGKAHFSGEGEARKVRAFAGTALDITERKLAQAALQDSEDRLRFLGELGEQTRATMDPEEVMRIILNSLGKKLQVTICAYGDVESDGETFRIRDDYTNGAPSMKGIYRLSDFGDEVAACMREGRTWIVRDAHSELSPPVREAFLSLSVAATVCRPLVKAGRLIAMMAVHQKEPRDWTEAEIQLVEVVIERAWATLERARVTRELIRSEANFRTLADAMPQMVFMANAEGHVDYFNQKWYEYTGLPDGSTGYEYWKDTHEESTLDHVVERWTHAVKTGDPYEIEYRLRRADGEWRWHLGRALPVRDSSGRIVRWFGTNTDIHEKKMLEERIQQLLESERFARHEAEEQGRIKDQFLATLSHELRTPLNAIVGWSDLLRRSSNPDDIAKGLEVISRNAHTQAQIIEDLLDLSRIVTGKIKLEVRPVNAVQVAREAIDTVRASAEERRLAIELLASAGNIEFPCDPDRLQQILWNLLNNAIKFTPENGRIEVEVSSSPAGVSYVVRDSGIGISKEFLQRIFDRFQQADATSTRRYGGLGIGLSIVKQLVELHGGTICAESEGENRGSKFTVTLPLGRPPAAHAVASNVADDAAPLTEPSGISLQGIRVLVVDDQADNRDFARTLLEDHGAAVETADSAAAAMACMAMARPDILVSDIAMPGTDGYSLLRAIRQIEAGTGLFLPAIALTAYARPEDRRAALEAGFQEHLAKPLDQIRLLQCIADLTGIDSP